MKKTRHFAFVPAIGLAALVAVLNCGCGQQEAPTPTPKPTVAKAEKPVPAEKTSFDAVTSQLDPGGNLYLYLSTEQWLDGLSVKASSWRQVAGSIPELNDEVRTNISKAFDIATRLIKESGVEDVSGVGMSSISREKGTYHSKLLVHHYKGKGTGFLWTMFGKEPHALAGLDFSPANTAMAAFSDLDLPMLWSVVQKQVAQSGIPQAQAFLDQLPAEFEKATQLKWDQVLASLGGEYGFILTLDESKMVPIPLPTAQGLQIPEPGILIIAKAKDDTVFNRVDRLLKENSEVSSQVISVDKPGLKMRTMAVPLRLPIQLRPTIASSGGYLFIASTDALIQEVLAVKAGQKPGLKSTEEFKRLAQGVPQTGNQFTFMSQRFGQTVLQVVQEVAKLNPSATAVQQQWMILIQPGQLAFAYNVSANTDEGWLTVGNGNRNPANAALVPLAVVPGMLAAIAIPNFVKARTTAQLNACINNLRMIDGAKQQWALEKNKANSATPTQAELQSYLGPSWPVCPAGGSYMIGSVGTAPKCSIAGHSLPN